MRTKLILSLLLGFVLAAMVGVVTYAQGPDTPPREPGAGEISTSSLDLPPGPGQTVLYMFTGAADNQNTGSPTVATVIFCTNISPVSDEPWADVEVQIVDRDGKLYSATKRIFPGQTATFSTRDTGVYDEVNSSPNWGAIINTSGDDINQGSGRILADTEDSTNLICVVKIIDPANNPPRFEARLPLYNSSGNPIDGINLKKTYLPLILK